MTKFSEFDFSKQSINSFLVEGIFFGRFIPIDVKKLLKFSGFSIGSVMVLSSAIMANTLLPFYVFWEIWFHVCLAILFWNLFYSAQIDVDSKFFFFFSLLVDLFYICIFIWLMLDQSLLLNFYFYYLFIKMIPFLHWSFNAFSCPWVRYYLVFSFFHCLNWCMFV